MPLSKPYPPTTISYTDWDTLADHYAGRPCRAIVDADGYGDYTTIQAAIVALTALGATNMGEILVHNGTYIEDLRIEEGDTLRLQPCFSPIWDTAWVIGILRAAGLGAMLGLALAVSGVMGLLADWVEQAWSVRDTTARGWSRQQAAQVDAQRAQRGRRALRLGGLAALLTASLWATSSAALSPAQALAASRASSPQRVDPSEAVVQLWETYQSPVSMLASLLAPAPKRQG